MCVVVAMGAGGMLVETKQAARGLYNIFVFVTKAKNAGIRSFPKNSTIDGSERSTRTLYVWFGCVVNDLAVFREKGGWPVCRIAVGIGQRQKWPISRGS